MIESQINNKSAVTTWAILLGTTALSVIVYAMNAESSMAGTVALTITAINWFIVGGWFMHLKDEPKWISGLLIFTLGCLVFLFVLIIADIWHNKGEDVGGSPQWTRQTAEEYLKSAGR